MNTIDDNKLNEVVTLVDERISKQYTKRELELFICADWGDVHGVTHQEWLADGPPQKIANWVSVNLIKTVTRGR